MELRQLRYFIEVASQRHYGRAAARLCVSQPALSQQIQLLEDELGLELFDRKKRKKDRKVELTEAGVFFAAEAAKILDGLRRVTETTRKIGHEQKSILLGVYKTSLREGIVALLKTFAGHFPEVEVRIAEFEGFAEVQEAVSDGRADLGITLLPLTQPQLACRVLNNGYLRVLLPSGHHLSGEAFVTFDQLKTEKWVEMAGSSNPYLSKINRIFEEKGIHRSIVQELPSLELLCSVVSMGLGIAFVPSLLDLSHFGGVTAKKLVNEDLSGFTGVEISQALIFRDDRENPLVRAMGSFVN